MAFAHASVQSLFLPAGNKMTNWCFTSQMWFQLTPQGKLSSCLLQLPSREQERNIWPIKNNDCILFCASLIGTCASIHNCPIHLVLWLLSTSAFRNNSELNLSGNKLHLVNKSIFCGPTYLVSLHHFRVHRINSLPQTQTFSNTELVIKEFASKWTNTNFCSKCYTYYFFSL